MVVSVHTVESTKETVRSGFFDPTAPPVATIESGDVVSYPNTWTHWGNEADFGMTFAEREPFRHRYPNGPYSMLGPVVVNGAEPGDVIECRLEVAPDPGLGLELLPPRRRRPAVRLRAAVRALLPLRRGADQDRVTSTGSPCHSRRSSASWRSSRPVTTQSAPSWPVRTAATWCCGS